MNEQIKKMMNDSRPLVAMESLSSWDELQKYADDWTEKFAELIVRECAEFVRKQNYESIRNEEPYNVTSTDILTHFGVEE